MSVRTRFWLAVALVAGVLLLLTGLLMPVPALAWFYDQTHVLGRVLAYLERSAFPFSRWFHLLIFAGLAVCLCALFPRLRLWQAAGLLLALGVAGELVQIPIPGRNPGIVDLVDDLIGIGLGLAIVALARLWRRNGPGALSEEP